jgi:amino acid permease
MSDENKEKLNLISKGIITLGTLFISVMVCVIGWFARDSYQTIISNQKEALTEIAELRKAVGAGDVLHANHEQRIATTEAAVAQIVKDVKNNTQDIEYVSVMMDLKLERKE